MITIERLALAGIGALLAWITVTVQALAVDIAVLKNNTLSSVSQREFITFSTDTATKLENHQVWLTRLSERVNNLETEREKQ